MSFSNAQVTEKMFIKGERRNNIYSSFDLNDVLLLFVIIIIFDFGFTTPYLSCVLYLDRFFFNLFFLGLFDEQMQQD